MFWGDSKPIIGEHFDLINETIEKENPFCFAPDSVKQIQVLSSSRNTTDSQELPNRHPKRNLEEEIETPRQKIHHTVITESSASLFSLLSQPAKFQRKCYHNESRFHSNNVFLTYLLRCITPKPLIVGNNLPATLTDCTATVFLVDQDGNELTPSTEGDYKGDISSVRDSFPLRMDSENSFVFSVRVFQPFFTLKFQRFIEFLQRILPLNFCFVSNIECKKRSL
jgi:hypothetical protein